LQAVELGALQPHVEQHQRRPPIAERGSVSLLFAAARVE
jgi:hypothetical protein